MMMVVDSKVMVSECARNATTIPGVLAAGSERDGAPFIANSNGGIILNITPLSIRGRVSSQSPLYRFRKHLLLHILLIERPQ